MNITYREYEAKDRDLLLTFTTKLAEYAKSLDSIGRVQNNPGFVESSLKETLEKVEEHHGKIYFALNDGKEVGYMIGVIWQQSEQNKLEIGPHQLGEVIDIYLDPEFRGQGIGKAMLQMMEAYFKQKGCDGMWIGVFADNQNAHNMYKSYGFIDREIGMLKPVK